MGIKRNNFILKVNVKQNKVNVLSSTSWVIEHSAGFFKLQKIDFFSFRKSIADVYPTVRFPFSHTMF